MANFANPLNFVSRREDFIWYVHAFLMIPNMAFIALCPIKAITVWHSAYTVQLNLGQVTGFCESCVEGKSHRLPFQHSSGKRADHPLELIHGDVSGKIGTESLGGGEYFVTFIDDHTGHVWVYILKHKYEVFRRFQERKAQVEKLSGRQIKALRSDNGGEYTSNEFESYMTKAT